MPLPILVNFGRITKIIGQFAFFALFFVFDLEFDLDLSIETTFKGILKKFKHIQQKEITLI